MPEGDTLWRTAAALRERILGESCIAAEPPSLRRLIGKRVTAVEAYGKHLFVVFDSGIALHTHLRMRGAWYVHRAHETTPDKANEIRAELTFPEWTAVVLRAPVVELVASADSIRHLGPDVLREGFDVTAVASAVHEQGERTIGEVLLDQRVAAGIGNIYRCESLWTHKVSPWQSVGSMSISLVEEIYTTAQAMMTESAVALPGRRRRAVHGHGGEPCPRCSHSVQVRNMGDPPRLVYWCPWCQK